MFRLNKTYLFLTIFLFLIEVFIALFLHDKIIRPYIGDLLVVILIYCFIRSFLNSSVVKTAICVLIFAYCIEILQYLNLVERLGLQHSKLANVILGNSFEWIDILAYTLGIVFVIGIEKIRSKGKTNKL